MAILLFITAFVLSGIAAYYSVIGLIAIFASAAIPVAIMGGSLEIAKLVVASWLYRFWKNIPFLMKSYFTAALIILMIVTSMGIFGFLSKAHIEQGVSTGDMSGQLSVIDEKIKIERDNIENARALIAQLDGVVNAMTTGQDRTARRKDGSEYIISSAERALSTRRAQSKDRANLTKQIEESQKRIIELQKEKAPISNDLRKIEAEVGPIKYVAAMIYGDNPDQNTLEKSVRWLIIILICVFDPLAVLMLIAANLTQIKQHEWKVKKLSEEVAEQLHIETPKNDPKYEPDDGALSDVQINQIKEPIEDHKITPETHSYLFQEKSFHSKPEGWVSAGPQVVKPVDKIEESVHNTEKRKATKKKIKKSTIKQNNNDKLKEETVKEEPFIPVLAEENTTESNNGLEEIYKQIVNELEKNKKPKPKSNHWGPLTTKK